MTTSPSKGSRKQDKMNIFTVLCVFSILGGCLGQEVAELQVKVENIRSNIYNVFSKGRNHLKPEYQEHKDRVRDFLYGYLSALKRDDAELHVVDFPSPLISFDNTTAMGRNFYLVFKGTNFGTSADRVIALTSQYDTFGDVPGVDNNGSGMTAFLEVARLIYKAQCPRPHTIILVANDFEEYGSHGIKEFINNFLVPVILKNGSAPDSPKFQGAICYDTMMNWNDTENSQTTPVPEEIFREFAPDIYRWYVENKRRGNFVLSMSRQESDKPLNDRLMVHWDRLPEAEKFKRLDLRIPCEGVITPDHDLYDLCRVFLRADYKEFYYYNGPVKLKALMVTDSAQYRGVMQDCYAKPCDDLSQVTDDKLVFLGKSAKMTLNTLLDMSGYNCPTVPPASTGHQETPLPLTFLLIIACACALQRVF